MSGPSPLAAWPIWEDFAERLESLGAQSHELQEGRAHALRVLPTGAAMHATTHRCGPLQSYLPRKDGAFGGDGSNPETMIGSTVVMTTARQRATALPAMQDDIGSLRPVSER
jgi:hypothetical protein